VFLSLSNPSVYLLYQGMLGAKRARRQAVEEYVRPLRGQRVLDIGCGPGYVSEYFEGVDYIGFDTDKAYIDYANRKYGRRGSFFCQEFDDTVGSRLEPFDIVMMNGLLHHLQDGIAVELLQRVKRVLKPGGKLVTLDCYYVRGQNFIVRKLLQLDRGKYIRQEKDYIKLVSGVFDTVTAHIRNDLMFIPYPLIVMQIS